MTKPRPRRELALRPVDPGAATRIVQDFLQVLRNQFYPDEAKSFFQQRWLLLKAISYPANYLAKRGVGLTEADHRQILASQIRTIQHHGNTCSIRHFARYFLHVVQQHMKFHGEGYYHSGKHIRSIADGALDSIRAKAAVQALETTDRLSEIHAAIKPPTRRKKTQAQPTQPELF